MASVRFGAKVIDVNEVGDRVTVTIEKESQRSVVMLMHHLLWMLVVLICRIE